MSAAGPRQGYAYRAAGCILVDGTRVLVLDRPDLDEIRLPKGHIEPGEQAEAAAVRETREETGYAQFNVLADLGTQSVTFDTPGKRTTRTDWYFLASLDSPAHAAGEPQFQPRWVSWDRAIRGLTFEIEQEWARRAQHTLLSGIFTIGYGNRPAAEFTGLLKKHGIHLLVDIRSVPYSRYNPTFRKAALAASLENQGIGYRYLGAGLGGRPTNPDVYVDGKVDASLVQALPEFQAGLAELVELAANRETPVAVLCAERKPENCHRTHLIGAALAQIGIQAWHIDEHGRLRTQGQVLARIRSLQPRLFD